MSKPACMDGREYAEWRLHNERVSLGRDTAPDPCHDCMEPFALEMRSKGRCDGEPRGSEDEDEAVVSSVSPNLRASAEARRRMKHERASRARMLFAAGFSQSEVAEQLGLTRSAIYKYRAEGLL